MSIRGELDAPMSCFRCYDMKVVDSVVLNSILEILKELHSGLLADYNPFYESEMLDRINSHIILLESMPDE